MTRHFVLDRAAERALYFFLLLNQMIPFLLSGALSLIVLGIILNIIYKSTNKIYQRARDSFDTLDEVASDPVKLILGQKILVGTTTKTNRLGESP